MTSHSSDLRPWPEGEPAARFTCLPPPSTNNLFVERRDRRGRAKTSTYKHWQDTAGMEIMVQRVPLVDGRVAVLIEAPFGARRDLDNIKPILDLMRVPVGAHLGMSIIRDDRYIDDLRVTRVTGNTMTVSVWRM